MAFASFFFFVLSLFYALQVAWFWSSVSFELFSSISGIMSNPIGANAIIYSGRRILSFL